MTEEVVKTFVEQDDGVEIQYKARGNFSVTEGQMIHFLTDSSFKNNNFSSSFAESVNSISKSVDCSYEVYLCIGRWRATVLSIVKIIC